MAVSNRGPFSPTIRLAAAVQANNPGALMTKGTSPGIFPKLILIGAVGTGIAVFVRTQLRKESDAINRAFSQQNTPETLARRYRNFHIDTEGDPRKTLFNILNW
ncbi:hypothetical protein VTH82DRAFT_5408 [Thermothelomyces myriococcoides]